MRAAIPSLAGLATMLVLASACAATPPSSATSDTGDATPASTGESSSASTGSSDTGIADTTTEDTGVVETGGGDPNLLIGSFQLQLTEPKPGSGGGAATPGATSIFGKIYDGATPEVVVWEPGTTAGACQLLTPRVPYCATPCGGSAACVEDDTCQEYPAAVGAGAVEVEGVATTDGATGFTMVPIANNYQAPVGTTLAYPAFGLGDLIELRAEGAEVSAFELAATGVAQLELVDDEIALDPTTDVNLAWVVTGGEESTVEVKLDISHHGGTKGKIECEAADTGSLVISATLVAELLELGVSGFPAIIVKRVSSDSFTTSLGRVDLEVSSSVERTVLIDGLVSCTDDGDCPDGQTCQPDLRCG